ncbi:hypothetical protein [Ureibacillus sp. FSL W8-0352]|uniref:hypothetical protein n=1 Tax=Ureibacillus sp. FSL W8-0352 TaxID=2954596 RepID=UPI0030FA9D89
METVTVAEQIANSQVVWSILCILLAGYVLWHSNKRETRLLDNLSELTKAQQEQAKAMQKISENLDTLEGRMDRMEKYTYKNQKEC